MLDNNFACKNCPGNVALHIGQGYIGGVIDCILLGMILPAVECTLKEELKRLKEKARKEKIREAV